MKTQKDDEEMVSESRARIELFPYMNNFVSEGQSVFKLCELLDMFQRRLNEFGIYKQTNRCRLKNWILEQFPKAMQIVEGRNVLTVFRDSLSYLLRDYMITRDYDDHKNEGGENHSDRHVQTPELCLFGRF